MAHILVVEDIPANRALASKLLRSAGHEVLLAETASEGVALAEEQLPDLVLMDLSLPDMDGREALDLLRRRDRTAELQIVAFTAHAMRGDRSKALAAGFDGYVTKPIDFATFVDTIGKLLR
jgi:two-component system, cell cycle response regulator DivK